MNNLRLLSIFQLFFWIVEKKSSDMKFRFPSNRRVCQHSPVYGHCSLVTVINHITPVDGFAFDQWSGTKLI